MKPDLILAHLSLLAVCATTGLHAAPFTMRTVPAGLDSAPQPPIAADFTGDGKLSWYGGGNVISHFPRPGTINLPVITLPGSVNATVVPLQAVAFDVDQDGDIDIVRINGWQGHSKAMTLQVFINDGAGNFTPGYRSDWTAKQYSTGEQRFRFNVADYDLDGDLDIALLNTYEYANYDFTPRRYEGALRILWNVGAQFNTFTNLQSLHFGGDADMDSADIDGDGDLDLVCTGHETIDSDGASYYQTRTFINGRSAGFSVKIHNWAMSKPRFVDVNRDGKPDILCNKQFSPGLKEVALWVNQSDHSLAQVPSPVTANAIPEFISADVLNTSGPVGAVAAATPLGSIIQANPGSHTAVLRLGVKNPGRPAGATSLTDPNIVVTGTKVRFFKALNNGGQWSMGAAMSKAEVQ